MLEKLVPTELVKFFLLVLNWIKIADILSYPFLTPFFNYLATLEWKSYYKDLDGDLFVRLITSCLTNCELYS